MAYTVGNGATANEAVSQGQFTAETAKYKRGTITIAAGAVAGAVLFPVAFGDALYRIALSGDAGTGLWWDTKAAAGFNVNIPGILGADLHVDWVAIHD
jgi:hypothetical protein